MALGNGWYLVGPLIAVGLVGLVGALVWCRVLQWTLSREPETRRDPYAEGLAIFHECDDEDSRFDYGLLGTATVTDAPEVADEIRRLLGEAGIRATQALSRDGRTAVLVFAEELEEARRLVGDTPAL